jgi:dynein heavy chain
MELAIFGKFELFCKRVQKLLDVSTTVQQFQSLAHHRMDGMDAHIKRFFDVVDNLKRNSADLLDYTKPAFDKEFIEFSKQIQELEASLQVFINSSFENITSTDNALALLHKFHCILQRQNLRQDLDGKDLVIFHNYGLDLENVRKTYERSKDNPPVPRKMPPVAGTVAWARQLLRRIEEPMQQFTNNTVILRAQKEARKIIRTIELPKLFLSSRRCGCLRGRGVWMRRGRGCVRRSSSAATVAYTSTLTAMFCS